MVNLLWYLYIITAQVLICRHFRCCFLMRIFLILLATAQMRVLLQNNHKYAGNSNIFPNLYPKSPWRLTLHYFGLKNLPIWHLLPWAWNNWQSQSPASVQTAPLRHSWGHEPASKHSSLLIDMSILQTGWEIPVKSFYC